MTTEPPIPRVGDLEALVGRVPVPDAPVPPISDDDKLKITVLLKEYDTLRQEVVGRISSRFGLVGFGSALGIYLISQQPTVGRLVIVALWAAVMAILWWRTGLLIHRCSLRLREIERLVNALARDQLLVWESRVGSRGWMRFYRSKTM
jgi:hypothetical protein